MCPIPILFRITLSTAPLVHKPLRHLSNYTQHKYELAMLGILKNMSHTNATALTNYKHTYVNTGIKKTQSLNTPWETQGGEKV
jgi:hypothetical protein